MQLLNILQSCKSSAVLQVSADSGCAQSKRPAIAPLCQTFRPCADSEVRDSGWGAAELLQNNTLKKIVWKTRDNVKLFSIFPQGLDYSDILLSDNIGILKQGNWTSKEILG